MLKKLDEIIRYYPALILTQTIYIYSEISTTKTAVQIPTAVVLDERGNMSQSTGVSYLQKLRTFYITSEVGISLQYKKSRTDTF